MSSKMLSKQITVTQVYNDLLGRQKVRVIHPVVYGCTKEELNDNVRKAKEYYNDRVVGVSTVTQSGKKVSNKGVSFSK